MIRVLHIARYRHSILDGKTAAMSRARDVQFSLIRPAPERAMPEALPERVTWIPMIGTNPHTAIYRSITFALRRIKPDLIHAEEEPDSIGAWQIALARRLAAPRARLIFDTWQNVDRKKEPHVRWVLHRSLRAADGMFAASDEAVRLLRRFGYRGPIAEVPRYGVDLSVFRPLDRDETQSSRAFTIMFAGRLISEKGIETLVDASAALPKNVRLLIVGDGPHKPFLASCPGARTLGDRVQFLPRLGPEPFAVRLAQADVLVLPSRTTAVWKEQYGRVLVEAMACGVPLIGSDSGAIPAVMGDAGLIFKESHTAGLQCLLEELLASPDRRRELAARGRARVAAHYSQDVIAAKTLGFYRELMAARS